MLAAEKGGVQRPFDLDALQGEVQEGFGMLLSHEARGNVCQPAGIAVQIEGVLPQVVAEPLLGEASRGERLDERMFGDAAVNRLGGFPRPIAPASHRCRGFQAVTAT